MYVCIYIYILGAEYGIWRYELAGDLAKTLSLGNRQILRGCPINFSTTYVSGQVGPWSMSLAERGCYTILSYYVCICATEIWLPPDHQSRSPLSAQTRCVYSVVCQFWISAIECYRWLYSNYTSTSHNFCCENVSKMAMDIMDIPIFQRCHQRCHKFGQVLIHYGHRYWLPESRRHVRLPTRDAADGLGPFGPRGQGYQGWMSAHDAMMRCTRNGHSIRSIGSCLQRIGSRSWTITFRSSTPPVCDPKIHISKAKSGVSTVFYSAGIFGVSTVQGYLQ